MINKSYLFTTDSFVANNQYASKNVNILEVYTRLKPSQGLGLFTCYVISVSFTHISFNNQLIFEDIK